MDSWLWTDRGILWRSCRLRRLRFKRDTRAATEIQRMARGMLGRRRRQRELQLRAQREQDAAALKVAGAAVVVIQRFARGWLARRLAGRLRTELRPEDRHFQKVRRTTFGAHDRINRSPLTPLLCLQVLFTSNAISERKSMRRLSERKRRRLGFNASPLFWTVSISGYEFVGMARDLAAAHDAAATEIQRYVRGRVRSRTILVWPRLHVLGSLS